MTGAVVTGSSGAIGAAVAARLQRAGWDVVGLDCAVAPSEATWQTIAVDLAEAEETVRAARSLPEHVGLVVHCAAHQPILPAQAPGDDEWARAWNVNVMSLQRLVAQVFPMLSSTAPGRVIAISSVHASQTSPDIAPYAATKAALNSYCRSLALDARSADVSAIAIELGATASPKLEEGLTRWPDPAVAKERLVSSLPAGRLVEADDVAGLVLWLAGPEALHLSGSVLAFSGGITAVLASEAGS